MTDFPGARWWRCDFHNHTPTSDDYRGDRGRPDRDWLLDYMRAGIDCLAVTDHNCGTRIDALRAALAALADERPADPDYRPLVLLPGVEITTAEGLHLLAVFDESEPADTINRVLVRVECPKLGKNHEKQCGKSALDTIEAIHREGGIAIAAHVDRKNGLYEAQATTSASGSVVHKLRIKPRTLAAILAKIDAAQVVDETGPSITSHLLALRKRVAIVAGSDAHKPEEVGTASTWIKMSRPTLLGLRLALLDHDGSAERFDPTITNRNTVPRLWLRKLIAGPLELRRSPNDGPLEVKFNPWFNAIIGGRGTGKSSLVELLRIALCRDADLDGERAGPLEEIRKAFESFAQASDKSDRGALRSGTRVRLELEKELQKLAIVWDKSLGLVSVDEHSDLGWAPVPESVSGDYVRSRFPATVLSQKQIYALAEQRGYLLDLLDLQPEVDRPEWQRRFDALRQEFLGRRAKARQLAPDLSQRPAIEAELRETERKLKALELSHHASSLQAYQRAQRQLGAQRNLLAKWQSDLDVLKSSTLDTNLFLRLQFDGFNPAESKEAEFLDTVEQIEAGLRSRYLQIQQQVADLEAEVSKLQTRFEVLPLQNTIRQAQDDYQALLDQLKSQGVDSPDQYAALVARKGQLQQQLKQLDERLKEKAGYEQQADDVLKRLVALRNQISEKRRVFIEGINARVSDRIRVSLQRFGTPMSTQPRFRELLKQPSAFAEDIYEDMEGGAKRGVLYHLYSTASDNFEDELAELKADIFRMHQEPGKHEDLLGQKVNKRLRTHIETKLSEFDLDELVTWFPDDGLELYFIQQNKKPRAVDHASAGQKSAAVLSLLLAFGDEPLIVDQPEDDLDNAMVMDLVVSQIRASKARRQLIVVTHNPNVVVNGDAEWVMPMSYHKGQIGVDATGLGAVAERGTRAAICAVMEGGERALRMRYKKMLEELN